MRLYFGIGLLVLCLMNKVNAQTIVWNNVSIQCTDVNIYSKFPALFTWDSLSFTRYEPKSNSIITFKYCNQTKHDSCKWIGRRKDLYIEANYVTDFDCVLIDPVIDNTEIINSMLMYMELKNYLALQKLKKK